MRVVEIGLTTRINYYTPPRDLVSVLQSPISLTTP